MMDLRSSRSSSYYLFPPVGGVLRPTRRRSRLRSEILRHFDGGIERYHHVDKIGTSVPGGGLRPFLG